MSLACHTAAAYAQCRSATGDSDTLLRAYSHVVIDAGSGRNLYPGSEGVLVKSTPRKLLFALRGSLPAGSPKNVGNRRQRSTCRRMSFMAELSTHC